MRRGDDRHPAPHAGGERLDLGSGDDLVGDDEVRPHGAHRRRQRVLFAGKADDVGTGAHVQRKVAVGGADLAPLVAEQDVDDAAAPDLPRQVAQDGGLAPPRRRKDEHAAQPRGETAAEDRVGTADHLVRDADVEGSDVPHGKTFAPFVHEYARKADALAARARQKPLPQLLGDGIDGILAGAGYDLLDVGNARRQRPARPRAYAAGAEVGIGAAVVAYDGLARPHAQLVHFVEVAVQQRRPQPVRQKFQHVRPFFRREGAFLPAADTYLYGKARAVMTVKKHEKGAPPREDARFLSKLPAGRKDKYICPAAAADDFSKNKRKGIGPHEDRCILARFIVQWTCSADVAKLADAPDLGSGGQPCRFKSCHPHHQRATKKI